MIDQRGVPVRTVVRPDWVAGACTAAGCVVYQPDEIGNLLACQCVIVPAGAAPRPQERASYQGLRTDFVCQQHRGMQALLGRVKRGADFQSATATTLLA